MKKILILFISVLFFIHFDIAGTQVNAIDATVANLEISTENVFAGDAVYVTVSLTSNPGLTYVKLKASYDTNALNLFGVLNGEVINDLTRGNSYVWSSVNTMTATGTFATLVFIVSEDASVGTYPITVACVEASNHNDDVAVSIQNGSIIVNAEECVHDMKSVSYDAPTCESSGSRVLQCTKCDYSETVNFDVVDCVAENEADCVNDAKCEYCGEVLESAYGHKYRTQVFEPTTTEEGYTLYTCMRCGDSYQDSVVPPIDNPDDSEMVPITGITLSKSSLDILVSDTVYIHVLLDSAFEVDGNFTWTSSDETVAMAFGYGENKTNASITGCSAGTATITVKTPDGRAAGQCVVTVFEEGQGVPVTGITLSASEVTLELGKNKWIDATVYPENATGRVITWTSSDYDVADIGWSGERNERGLIISNSTGTAIITATTADGSFSATCTVTVTDPAEPDGDEVTPDPDAPAITVASVTAAAGKTAEVTIALKNNPGIASMKLKVSYDEEMLTLQSIKYNTAIGGQFQQPQTMASPVTLNWYNGGADSEGDFVYATLVFAVKDNAPAGDANVTVTYDPEDVYNIGYDNIEFGVENGKITVVDYIPGDINGDGSVNNKDLSVLFQYLSDWDVSVVEAALDVNGDGNVNNKDLSLLFQYLSDWDVEIH